MVLHLGSERPLQGLGFYFEWMRSHWSSGRGLPGSDLRVSELTLTALLKIVSRWTRAETVKTVSRLLQ